MKKSMPKFVPRLTGATNSSGRNYQPNNFLKQEERKMALCKDTPGFQCKEFSSMKKLLSLKGKNALITGGAGGIGRSVGKAMAELGANIILVDIVQREKELQGLVTEIQKMYGVKASCVTGDVASEKSVNEFISRVTETFGKIHILHNNAGVILPDDGDDVPYEKWKWLMSIDLDGAFLVGRAVANHMKEHGEGGAIINTASMSGHIINRSPNHDYGTAYCTAKAAVKHMTKAMAGNYIKYGIRINSISPGVVLSGIHDNIPAELMEFARKEVPLGRFGSLDEIASIVAFMATDAAGFMVGTDILVDGGQCIN
jgi:NAD(P)-dependent dehydrogenase (short-subunit alcohol dehydrogenase family)